MLSPFLPARLPAMPLTFALQALLARHEAYVADSERERKQMLSTIETLEREKLELETKNAQTIKANRDLLDRLEHLNEAVTTSDAHIQALSATLRSTEDELERLTSLAARTQLLEQQLLDLEREQSQLQNRMDAKLVDERSAIQRWKSAERTIGDLQDQIDRIEKESREERERHVEVVARMERRMVVESELNTAAGRLKAKAGHDKPGSTDVSHFVKDILLDNANLQHGILELREMLTNSNEEVERLRDQLKIHQPVSTSPVEDVSTPSLQKELGLEADAMMNQELHIHHHYHGPKIATKNVSKPSAPRRPKKKRFSLGPTHFDPPSPLDRSSAVAILNSTAVTVPNSHRWSQASTLTSNSFPGSPTSDSHRGSMYDRVFSDAAYDSSRPTSPPDSIDMRSPMFGPTRSDIGLDRDHGLKHGRRSSRSLKPSGMSFRSSSTPISMVVKSSPATAVISAVSPANSLSDDQFTLSPSIPPEPQAAIPEENEETPQPTPQLSIYMSPEALETDDIVSTTPVRPLLRRHASHESLISVSGMDIHTLQSRPAQLLYSSSCRLTRPGNAGSVGPELTPWTATAHGTLSRNNLDTGALNRSLLSSRNATLKRGSRKSDGPSSATDTNGSSTASLGRKVGGWVFGKWGATPAAPDLSRPPSTKSQETQPVQGAAPTEPATLAATVRKKADKPTLRPSGVNQSGPMWGFFDVPETPTNIVVKDYDADALGEALAEDMTQ